MSEQVFPQARSRVSDWSSAYEAARGAHALLLRLRHLMELPVLVDGRNLYDPGATRQPGFEYVSTGRDGAINPALQFSVETRLA
jgi:hypothetical protein